MRRVWTNRAGWLGGRPNTSRRSQSGAAQSASQMRWRDWMLRMVPLRNFHWLTSGGSRSLTGALILSTLTFPATGGISVPRWPFETRCYSNGSQSLLSLIASPFSPSLSNSKPPRHSTVQVDISVLTCYIHFALSHEHNWRNHARIRWAFASPCGACKHGPACVREAHCHKGAFLCRTGIIPLQTLAHAHSGAGIADTRATAPVELVPNARCGRCSGLTHGSAGFWCSQSSLSW